MRRPLVTRNLNFALLWISQVVSQGGSRMFQIALIWWILSNIETNSGLMLGVFMVVGALPAIIAVKWIGRIIDSNPSKRVLLTVDTLGLLASSGLAFALINDVFNLALIFGATFLFAIFQGFIDPTLNRAVPELVPEDDVENAVAFISSTQTLASFTGAVAGAILIDRVGLTGIVLINGLSYLISIVCDGSIKFRKAREVTSEDQTEKPQSAWSYLGNFPLIKALLVGFAMINFFGTPILVLLPLYTQSVLQASATTLSALEACIWLGILTGTFGSPLIGWREDPLKIVTAGLFLFGSCLALPAAGLGVYPYAICLFVAGCALGILNVRMITLFQQIITDSMKGRFFALLQAMCSFAVPIGYFLFGYLSDFVSTLWLCGIQGAGVLTITGYFIYLGRRRSELSGYATPAAEGAI